MTIVGLANGASRPEVARRHQTDKKVVLDHGTGAKLSHELVSLIIDALGDVYVGELEDSAICDVSEGRIAITTDSFVMDPPFFQNGDIGKVAVCGTVNDLAVAGATPRYLTLGMILETGLSFEKLVRVATSIRDAAREANVKIVAGDTKVVRAGEADQIYLNTTGVGVYRREPLRMRDVRPGDKIVLSGTIGDHTVHLLSIREGLGFEQRVASDCAPVNHMIDDVLRRVGAGVRSMRDVTRGGLSAVLHEYATKLGYCVSIREDALPIRHETRMATDMLGINALHAANEGCVALFVAPDALGDVLECLRAHRYGSHACVIGEVSERAGNAVEMVVSGGRRVILEELEGAELPRLC